MRAFLAAVTIALVSLPAIPANANILASARATATCSGYTIVVRGIDLHKPSTVTYKITLTSNAGSQTVSGAIPVRPDRNFRFQGSQTETWAHFGITLNSAYNLSGTATLLSSGSTVNIVFSPPTLTCFGACSALKSASNYAVLGLQSSIVNLSSGPLRIYGNAGIGQNGQFNFSGGGQISGVLDADPTAQLNISGGGTTIAGGITQMSMAGVQTDALNAAKAAAALQPTQSFDGITNAQTIVGNGGLNVIAVTNVVHLSGGNNLTISGGASDVFVFQLNGGMQLDGGANIVLSGAVTPGQVLFYFPGTGSWAIQTSGKADTAGIFLAPFAGIQINGGVHDSEFITGQTASFQSNPVVNQACPAD